MVDHGNITVNTSNNSMFLFQKAIEIDKSLISTTPRNLNEARNASPPSFCIKMLDSIFRRIYQGVNHNLLLQLFLIGFCLFAVNLEKQRFHLISGCCFNDQHGFRTFPVNPQPIVSYSWYIFKSFIIAFSQIQNNIRLS